MAREEYKRRQGPSGNELGRAVNQAARFPTPTTKANALSPSMQKWPAHRNLWPTPTKSDGEGGPGNSGREGGENLRTAAGGSLNPTWVEWLMGFPPGWTDCGASETRSSRKSPNGSATESSSTNLPS
jgi:hypothetical protein